MSETGYLRTETAQEERERRTELERVTDGAVTFARHLVTHWPQVDCKPHFHVELDEGGKHVVDLPPLPEGLEAEPQLNYYLGGSLATRLLSRAEAMSPLISDMLPGIAAKEPVAIPHAAREALLRIAKPISDVDYIPTRHYKEQQARVQRLYDSVTEDEYLAARKKLLSKGGGGPAVEDVTDKMKAGMRIAEGQGKIMIDPVTTFGQERVVRLSIDGQEYFVASPDSLLAHKVLHAVQKFNAQAAVMARDLQALLEANLKLYEWPHLVAVASQVLQNEEHSILKSGFNSTTRPRSVCVDLAKDHRLSPLVRRFIHEIAIHLH